MVPTSEAMAAQSDRTPHAVSPNKQALAARLNTIFCLMIRRACLPNRIAKGSLVRSGFVRITSLACVANAVPQTAALTSANARDGASFTYFEGKDNTEGEKRRNISNAAAKSGYNSSISSSTYIPPSPHIKIVPVVSSFTFEIASSFSWGRRPLYIFSAGKPT